MKTIIKILLLVFIISTQLYSQTEQDSTVSVQISDSVYVMTKSPLGAMIRSALIPGWGQIYNEAYWKAPIVWGVLGYFVYVWIDNNNNYGDYRDLYSASITDDNPSGNSKYLQNREFYKDQRDEFAVYIGLTYFLTMIDAFVDSHLFDFDVSENPMTRTPQIDLRIHF